MLFDSLEEEESEDGDNQTDEGDGDTDDPNDPQGERLRRGQLGLREGGRDRSKYIELLTSSCPSPPTGTSVVLSSRAKCVRWLHSQTVWDSLEAVSFLVQPSVAHCPLLSSLVEELVCVYVCVCVCVCMCVCVCVRVCVVV